MNSSFLLLSLVLLVEACKSYHPTPGLKESWAKPSSLPDGPTPAKEPNGVGEVESDDPPANSLIISKLKLPSEAARYSRSCIVLQSQGKEDLRVKDYKFGSPLDLTVGTEYNVVVEVYDGSSQVYSSAYCESSNRFEANPGRNILSIPVCPQESKELAVIEGCQS